MTQQSALRSHPERSRTRGWRPPETRPPGGLGLSRSRDQFRASRPDSPGALVVEEEAPAAADHCALHSRAQRLAAEASNGEPRAVRRHRTPQSERYSRCHRHTEMAIEVQLHVTAWMRLTANPAVHPGTADGAVVGHVAGDAVP